MSTLVFKTKAAAAKQVGGLSNPKKMPCKSYGIPAKHCKVGSRLRPVKNSACSKCYAHKGMYGFPNVQAAQQKRFETLEDLPSWTNAMIKLISGSAYFRWHDSGDIQSLEHLLAIVKVCKATPDTLHWIPTREAAICSNYMREHGEYPKNLLVRVSATMIDGAPSSVFDHTSTIHKNSPAIGSICNAYKTQKDGSTLSPTEIATAKANKVKLDLGYCGGCRACWDTDVENVSYPLH